MSTKIFCDIAELSQIKKFNKKKIVKGFTTNPSLMKKAGAKDYKSYSKQILEICRNGLKVNRYLKSQNRKMHKNLSKPWKSYIWIISRKST